MGCDITSNIHSILVKLPQWMDQRIPDVKRVGETASTIEKKRFHTLQIVCDGQFDRSQPIIDADWIMRPKSSQEKCQDSGDLRVWAAAENGDERIEDRARLAMHEHFKEPGGDQPRTNREAIAAQNCQHVQGSVGLVSVRGLQFGE
jgi:hypothetical protein